MRRSTFPSTCATSSYMILREGVRNAVAHSGSDRIDVGVKITPKEVISNHP